MQQLKKLLKKLFRYKENVGKFNCPLPTCSGLPHPYKNNSAHDFTIEDGVVSGVVFLRFIR